MCANSTKEWRGHHTSYVSRWLLLLLYGGNGVDDNAEREWERDSTEHETAAAAKKEITRKTGTSKCEWDSERLTECARDQQQQQRW